MSHLSALAVTGKATERWEDVSPLWHLIPGLLAEADLLAACAVSATPVLITEGGPASLLESVASAFESMGCRDMFEYHFNPKYMREQVHAQAMACGHQKQT